MKFSHGGARIGAGKKRGYRKPGRLVKVSVAVKPETHDILSKSGKSVYKIASEVLEKYALTSGAGKKTEQS